MWSGPDGYLRPDLFLDHLTVIKNIFYASPNFPRIPPPWIRDSISGAVVPFLRIFRHFPWLSFNTQNRLINKNPRNHQGNTPLHFAAEAGNCQIVKMLVLQLEEKNPKNANRKTPLHYAAIKGHYEVFRIIASLIDDKNPSE